jgi:hypothetical protein
MNRRGFLSALALAPLAAVVAPVAMTRSVAGSPIRAATWASLGTLAPGVGALGFVGEAAGESILPLSVGNSARVMQSVFNASFGASEQSDKAFDELAAYCDELVEVAEA